MVVRGVWDDLRAELDPAGVSAGERIWQTYMTMIGSMRSAGVKLLAGADVPWQADQPDAPLHDELELLVKAGLTPMEALQAATRNAADFLGTPHTHGTLDVGKVADIVLLGANPLDNIANTRNIRTVIRAGRVLP